MARQRFIWPDIWKDPVFGRLNSEEKVFFIACFSLADDEGRLLADSASLRGDMFRFSNHSLGRIQKIRDAVCQKVPSVHLYTAQGQEYIALLKWSDYQRPKYPTPSKIPPPFLQGSPKPPPVLEEDSSTGWDGLGRDGLVKERRGSSEPVDNLEEAESEFFAFAERVGLTPKQKLRALQVPAEAREDAMRVTVSMRPEKPAAYFSTIVRRIAENAKEVRSTMPLSERLERFVKNVGWMYDDATLADELRLAKADVPLIGRLLRLAAEERKAA